MLLWRCLQRPFDLDQHGACKIAYGAFPERNGMPENE
jgi:hypothetical protein